MNSINTFVLFSSIFKLSKVCVIKRTLATRPFYKLKNYTTGKSHKERGYYNYVVLWLMISYYYENKAFKKEIDFIMIRNLLNKSDSFEFKVIILAILSPWYMHIGFYMKFRRRKFMYYFDEVNINVISVTSAKNLRFLILMFFLFWYLRSLPDFNEVTYVRKYIKSIEYLSEEEVLELENYEKKLYDRFIIFMLCTATCWLEIALVIKYFLWK